jgi:hypothetical protein
MYYLKVMDHLYNQWLGWSRGYRHFFSYGDRLYENLDHYKILSVNNRALDLARLGNDYRISRFIRDPRDLVVSGYFYHKRGSEKWCNQVNPQDQDWQIINGCIPEGMGEGHSFTSYLNSLDQEAGLMAEIEFRRYHFESMLAWPDANPQIKIFRYEAILGQEVETFRQLFGFYDLPWLEREMACVLARRFSAQQHQKQDSHIRNPAAGQWQQYFTPRVEAYFHDRHQTLVEKLGYAS